MAGCSARSAVVLGAGGPVGHAFHAGVLAALAEAGWDARRAELLIGTSIGAVTAGLLRAGLAPQDLFAHATGRPMSPAGSDLLQRGWPESVPSLDLSRRRKRGLPSSPALVCSLLRHPRKVRLSLLGAAIGPAGNVSTAVIADGFGRLLGEAWPGSPLWIVAVDLDSGRRTVFGRPGDPASTPGMAVAGSCSVPSFFAPVEIDGHRYVDGGVLSPSNTDLVGAEGSGPWQAVVASVPMGVGGWPNRTGVDLPGRLRNYLQARRGLAPLEAQGVRCALFAPAAKELEVMHLDAFDLRHLPQIAERARVATRWRIDHDDSLASMVGCLATPT